MNRYDSSVASDLNGTQAVIDIAMRAGEPKKLEVGRVYAMVTNSGIVQKVDLTGSEYTGLPPRKSGTTIVSDVESFLSYFEKHGDDDSELFADVRQRTITAVLDAHEVEVPRWGEHRLQLRLQHTLAWDAWKKIDGEYLTQEAFAEFVEDHVAEIAQPDKATMLELVESFSATTSAHFSSGTKLASGQRHLTYVEDVQAKAGARGDIVIPATLTLALSPFEGVEPFGVIARFRYRIKDKELRLGIKLDRPEMALAAAFADVRALIDSATPMAVLSGSPSNR